MVFLKINYNSSVGIQLGNSLSSALKKKVERRRPVYTLIYMEIQENGFSEENKNKTLKTVFNCYKITILQRSTGAKDILDGRLLCCSVGRSRLRFQQ